jgi:hypothetical protein
VIVRCNSSGPLYPLQLPTAHALAAASAPWLWHLRLGHPGHEVLAKVALIIPFCNKAPSSQCHACQLGRHTRLPFQSSNSRATSIFDLCGHRQSLVPSVSGFKYYLLVLDGCSHYSWTFPLRVKSDTFSALANFFSYVHTQFGTMVKAVQCIGS